MGARRAFRRLLTVPKDTLTNTVRAVFRTERLHGEGTLHFLPNNEVAVFTQVAVRENVFIQLTLFGSDRRAQATIYGLTSRRLPTGRGFAFRVLETECNEYHEFKQCLAELEDTSE